MYDLKSSDMLYVTVVLVLRNSKYLCFCLLPKNVSIKLYEGRLESS
jgi:hypothetical protein